MNRKNGLLAFLCTFIVVGAVALQVPFVSGTSYLAATLEGKAIPGRSSLLAKVFTPPTAAQIPTDPSGKPVVTLFEVQRQQRADTKLRELAKRNHIPFAVLKAYLALWSKGEVDENGFYWGIVPGKTNISPRIDEKENGRQSTISMAKKLGSFARQTSSYLGAIIATGTGIMRATRIAKHSAKSQGSFLNAMNLSMPAYQRDESEKQFCTVMGLAAALEATWPVEDQDLGMPQGRSVRLNASPGEKVLAPMAGNITFVGSNDGGICVEIKTVCDMYATICDMKSSSVTSGQDVSKGTAIGISGSRRPIYNVWLESYPIDSSQFLKPSERKKQKQFQAPEKATEEKTLETTPGLRTPGDQTL